MRGAWQHLQVECKSHVPLAVFQKVILLSESLKEAFSELDMTSEVLQITMSPSQPYFRCVLKLKSFLKHHFLLCSIIFTLNLPCNYICKSQRSSRYHSSYILVWFVLVLRLSTFGNSGNAHYDYPKDSEMMELFRCTTTQTNRSAKRNTLHCSSWLGQLRHEHDNQNGSIHSHSAQCKYRMQLVIVANVSDRCILSGRDQDKSEGIEMHPLVLHYDVHV